MMFFQATRVKDAIREGDAVKLRKLLDKGADPNARGEFDRPPLELAVLRDEPQLALMLIEAGARPETYYHDGSLLGLAVAKGYVETARMLIEKFPALLHMLEDDGDAPLHVAAKKGHVDIVSLLIDAGADPAQKNAKNRTPLYLAQNNHHDDVVTILEKFHEEVPLPKPVMPRRLQDEAAAAADAQTGKWHKLADDRIAHVTTEEPIHYRITEIFNFATRECTRIYQNLQTKAESAETRGFDDIAEKAPLERALSELQSRGGKVDEDAALPRLNKPANRRPNGG